VTITYRRANDFLAQRHNLLRNELHTHLIKGV
jgi:hypothetical protein